ncbi:MAG TPA: hypothetical protein VHX86_17190 [Tepidisphaeraceae bacterium]|nr:hypothetical protein [Tepidisphaeraceae bacterium]
MPGNDWQIDGEFFAFGPADNRTPPRQFVSARLILDAGAHAGAPARFGTEPHWRYRQRGSIRDFSYTFLRSSSFGALIQFLADVARIHLTAAASCSSINIQLCPVVSSFG